MPEGPEVKTIVDGLNKILKRKEIKSIKFTSEGKYRDHAPDHYKKFTSLLPMKIENVKCRGKFIYFTLQKNVKEFFIGNCLGMSGIWTSRPSNDGSYPKHTCMILETNDKENKYLFFVDQRHFGSVYFYLNRESFLSKLEKIGPDYLNNHVTKKEFVERIKRHSRMNISNLLMNQNIISGIGNYIKSEILYISKISPHRKVLEIPDEKLKNLYKAMEKVMVASYANRGMSQENYVDVEGKKGDYVYFLKVYRKKKDPEGRPVKAEKLGGGRTTYWVESIQK